MGQILNNSIISQATISSEIDANHGENDWSGYFTPPTWIRFSLMLVEDVNSNFW